MQTGVVEPRDVSDDRDLHLATAGPRSVCDELGLEAVDEAYPDPAGVPELRKPKSTHQPPKDGGLTPPQPPTAHLRATRNRPLRHRAQPASHARQEERKGITYYACCYRIAYGDKAAEALGHGKWQYVREDVLLPAIDRFFATNIFGAQRIHHLRAQHADLGQSIATEETQEHERLREQIADIEHRIEMQVRAIEAGVEPALVSARIDALKHEQQDLQRALATSERSTAARPTQISTAPARSSTSYPSSRTSSPRPTQNCGAKSSTPSSSPSRSTATSPRYD